MQNFSKDKSSNFFVEKYILPLVPSPNDVLHKLPKNVYGVYELLRLIITKTRTSQYFITIAPKAILGLRHIL